MYDNSIFAKKVVPKTGHPANVVQPAGKRAIAAAVVLSDAGLKKGPGMTGDLSLRLWLLLILELSNIAAQSSIDVQMGRPRLRLRRWKSSLANL